MLEPLFQYSYRPEGWNFIRKETLTQVFSCEFCEIFRTPFLQSTSGGFFRNTLRVSIAGLKTGMTWFIDFSNKDHFLSLLFV